MKDVSPPTQYGPPTKITIHKNHNSHFCVNNCKNLLTKVYVIRR